MTAPSREYAGSDLAILVPTKDRPEKMKNLLESIAAQGVRPGRVIIINGGKSIEHVTEKYRNRLPVEYYQCQPPGQIRQRNMGIAMLDETTPLVASFDDDIVLEANALNEMVSFWNKCDPKTAGVSFNIINGAKESVSFIGCLLGITARQPGRVLRSGITTGNTHAKGNFKSQWLCGGATVWKLRILREFSHSEIPSLWAIAEDLIFSYPVGKKYPLYVCASARVRHEHEMDYTKRAPHRFHGYTQTIWLFYFVEKNKDLSRTLLLWTLLARASGRVLRGLLKKRNEDIEFAAGQIEGARKALSTVLRGHNIQALLKKRMD